MKTYTVVRKEVRKVDAGSNYLVLHVVDLAGREREAVVSGHTFDRVSTGDRVELSE